MLAVRVMFPKTYFPNSYFPSTYWPGGTTSSDVVITLPRLNDGATVQAPALVDDASVTVTRFDVAASLPAATVLDASDVALGTLASGASQFPVSVAADDVVLLSRIDVSAVHTQVSLIDSSAVPLSVLNAGAGHTAATVHDDAVVALPRSNAGTEHFLVSIAPEDVVTLPRIDVSAVHTAVTLLSSDAVPLPLTGAQSAQPAPTLVTDDLVGLGRLEDSTTHPLLHLQDGDVLALPLSNVGTTIYPVSVAPEDILTLPRLEAGASPAAPTIVAADVIVVPVLQAAATESAPRIADDTRVSPESTDVRASVSPPAISSSEQIVLPRQEATVGITAAEIVSDDTLKLPVTTAAAEQPSPTILSGDAPVIGTLRDGVAIIAPSLIGLSPDQQIRLPTLEVGVSDPPHLVTDDFIVLIQAEVGIAFTAESATLRIAPPTLCVASCTPTTRDCVFERINLTPAVQGGTAVQWLVRPEFRAPTPWRFRLDVSDNGVQWTTAAGPVTDAVMLVDTQQRWFGASPRLQWRLVLIDGQGMQHPSVPLTLNFHSAGDRRAWRMAREALRQQSLALRKTDLGQPGRLLKRKVSGTPCPICLDARREEPGDPRCPSCLGTGWVGGYHSPVQCVWAALQPVANGEDLEQSLAVGTVANIRTIGRFLAVPRLDPFDVWVQERSDLRWVVRSVRVESEIQGIPLLYTAELRLAALSDPIYSIPVY